MFLHISSGQIQLILFGALDGFQSILVKPIHCRVPSVPVELPSVLQIYHSRVLSISTFKPTAGAGLESVLTARDRPSHREGKPSWS